MTKKILESLYFEYGWKKRVYIGCNNEWGLNIVSVDKQQRHGSLVVVPEMPGSRREEMLDVQVKKRRGCEEDDAMLGQRIEDAPTSAERKLSLRLILREKEQKKISVYICVLYKFVYIHVFTTRIYGHKCVSSYSCGSRLFHLPSSTLCTASAYAIISVIARGACVDARSRVLAHDEKLGCYGVNMRDALSRCRSIEQKFETPESKKKNMSIESEDLGRLSF